jgi:hypothetical protein
MDWDAIKTGIKASIIASCCCSLPLALAFLAAATGIGSITAALHIAQYGEFFYVLGTVFLAASIYLTIKNRSHGSCTISDAKTHWKVVIISVLTYILITITLIYSILPLIAQLLFS